MTDDAARRRARTHDLLAADGVPFRPGLVLLPDAAALTLPDAGAAALRALALLLIAGEATGMRPDLVDRLIDLYRPPFSPAEWRFFESEARDPAETMELGWRFEAALPLLWATGLADTLPRPDAQAQPFDLLKPVVAFDRAELLARAALRDPSEILDAADLHLCWEDASRLALPEGLPAPAGLNGGVLVERHHAFTWLLQGGGDWDAVATAGNPVL